MLESNEITLYVKDSSISANFYSKLLGKEPTESSENFAWLALSSTASLYLWRAESVEPKVQTMGSGIELTFSQADQEAVDALYNEWQKQGITIVQTPTQMEFGYTFTALDPDGHRLRVYTSATCV